MDAALPRTVPAIEGNRVLTAALVALVAGALLMRLRLVYLLNVNWDEFYYLGEVHSYLRGELSLPLQTFHVHFFSWLAGVAQNEVDQVIAARLAMYVLLLGSTALTYAIARYFLDRASALFAVLCYLSFSFAVQHGTSFRADPIANFLFLASVTLLLWSRGRILGPVVAGLAAATAVMITIKSLFYLPVLGAMLLAAFADRKRWVPAARRMVAFGGAFLAGFAVLYLLHQATLAESTVAASTRLVEGSANKVIMLHALFPRPGYLLQTLVNDAVIWLALLCGAALLMARVFRADHQLPQHQLLMLVYLLPLATLIFYRNAYPYYYVFLLSPAVVLSGIAYQRVLPARDARGKHRSYLLAAGFALAVSVNLGKVYLANSTDRTALQRTTVALVHELFPRPVAYIDRTNTVASFRKVGFFMSTWGIENYRGAGVPIFRDLIIKEQPLFLLADRDSIDPRVDQAKTRATGPALFDEDYRVIADNYVHHWGDLYVAGKTLRLDDGAAGVDFEMLIPGRYTLESATPVEIDGRRVAPGDTVVLNAGQHRAASLRGVATTAVLRWGDHLPRPGTPAPPQPLFAEL